MYLNNIFYVTFYNLFFALNLMFLIFINVNISKPILKIV